METQQTDYKTGTNVLVKQSRIGTKTNIDNDSIILSSEIGAYCDIEKRNLIRAAKIGDMTYTGADTSIMWAEVGKYCCISRLVDIGGNEHNYHAVSMMPDYRLKNRLCGKIRRHPDEEPVRIGNDVWIGQGVSVVRKEGLTVGDGAVLGAGAVITKSIPPYAVAAGVPARVIRYRFPEEQIAKLLEIRWWDWPYEMVVKNWPLLSADLTAGNLDLLAEEYKKYCGASGLN